MITYRIGLKDNPVEITKPIFSAREATVPNILKELAHVPKLMPETELHEALQTIIFSLKDNRKSEGRRLVLLSLDRI